MGESHESHPGALFVASRRPFVLEFMSFEVEMGLAPIFCL